MTKYHAQKTAKISVSGKPGLLLKLLLNIFVLLSYLKTAFPVQFLKLCKMQNYNFCKDQLKPNWDLQSGTFIRISINYDFSPLWNNNLPLLIPMKIRSNLLQTAITWSRLGVLSRWLFTRTFNANLNANSYKTFIAFPTYFETRIQK